MPQIANQAVPYAQQQLALAIAELKQGGSRDAVLPMLETVLTQLQMLSTHDHLTGALNRRALLAQLDSELLRSLRTGHTFTIAVIGIDHLPGIMERHGKEAAKKILQMVAQEVSAILRTLDTVGRIAATEFAIVMPTTWLDQSLTAIARLQACIAAVDWSGVVPGEKLSFCTGLTANAPGDTALVMLARARAALDSARIKGPGNIAQLENDLPGFDPESSV